MSSGPRKTKKASRTSCGKGYSAVTVERIKCVRDARTEKAPRTSCPPGRHLVTNEDGKTKCVRNARMEKLTRTKCGKGWTLTTDQNGKVKCVRIPKQINDIALPLNTHVRYNSRGVAM